LFAIAIGSGTPLVVYNCNWNDIPKLQTLRTFFNWFYIIVGIAGYIVATVIVLVSCVLRIRSYGMENGSWIKTFLNLLKSHLSIFIPPISFIICNIPYTIVVNTQNPAYSYYQCGISLGDFTIKFILEVLPDVPFVLTWLLFVYPSRVYMTEFYLNTWSGQCVANIYLMLFKRSNDKENNLHRGVTNPTNNEHDN
jgi:hypothetical protein